MSQKFNVDPSEGTIKSSSSEASSLVDPSEGDANVDPSEGGRIGASGQGGGEEGGGEQGRGHAYGRDKERGGGPE